MLFLQLFCLKIQFSAHLVDVIAIVNGYVTVELILPIKEFIEWATINIGLLSVDIYWHIRPIIEMHSALVVPNKAVATWGSFIIILVLNLSFILRLVVAQWCHYKRYRLWVRSPFKEMKCLIFSFVQLVLRPSAH